MEEPVYNAQELTAYYQGRDAKKRGADYMDCPHPSDPRGGNPLKWAWEQGYLDEEIGTSLQDTLAALKAGMMV